MQLTETQQRTAYAELDNAYRGVLRCPLESPQQWQQIHEAFLHLAHQAAEGFDAPAAALRTIFDQVHDLTLETSTENA